MPHDAAKTRKTTMASTNTTTMMDDDSSIALVYGAQRAEHGGGWRPSVTRNGRETWGSWGTALDRDEAERIAKLDAHEQAGRYVGDWTITIERRS